MLLVTKNRNKILDRKISKHDIQPLLHATNWVCSCHGVGSRCVLSPPQLTTTRQLSADPAALEPSLPSRPPPLLLLRWTIKPVTPLRHRTGVTFSFCAALYALPLLCASLVIVWFMLRQACGLQRWRSVFFHQNSKDFARFLNCLMCKSVYLPVFSLVLRPQFHPRLLLPHSETIRPRG